MCELREYESDLRRNKHYLSNVERNFGRTEFGDDID